MLVSLAALRKIFECILNLFFGKVTNKYSESFLLAQAAQFIRFLRIQVNWPEKDQFMNEEEQVGLIFSIVNNLLSIKEICHICHQSVKKEGPPRQYGYVKLHTQWVKLAREQSIQKRIPYKNEVPI